jgi:peptidoglycan hydrolase-like protein with peptidoglycan-binding domain
MKKSLSEQLNRIYNLTYGKTIPEEKINTILENATIKDDAKKADLVSPEVDEFFNNLDSINEPLLQQKNRSMEYQKNVEIVQIALTLLNYQLPVFGIDGLYGPETATAVQKFKTDNDFEDTIGSVVSTEMSDLLLTKLKKRGIKPDELKKLTDFDTPNAGKPINTNSGNDNEVVSDDITSTNVIIGDSQTPYLDNATSKAKRIPYLCKGGVAVNWLKDRLLSYQTKLEVKNVILVIGTNGVFGKFSRDDIGGLFNAVKKAFPNARILVVQGSWGWSNSNRNVTAEFVRNYYRQYEALGGIVIEPPIGNIEPHQNHKVYSIIGSKLDGEYLD